MADNVWSRWIRFRCTVQNYLDGEEYMDQPVINIDIDASAIDNYDETTDIYSETLGGPDSPDIRRSNGT
jgi:hypothetical protein